MYNFKWYNFFSITCYFEAQSPLYGNGMVKEVPFIHLCTTKFLSGNNIAFLNTTKNAMIIVMYVKQMKIKPIFFKHKKETT